MRSMTTSAGSKIASSQGDNSYLIIDMDDDFAVIGKFRIAINVQTFDIRY